MSGADAVAEEASDAAEPTKKPRPTLLLIGAAAFALVALGAGAWFSGMVPRVLGMSQTARVSRPQPPVFLDLPEMVANLNSDPRRPRYIKIKARLEIPDKQDLAKVSAAMPQLQDLFQTYLREQRPEDLEGAIGTYRLREELIARADVAAAPAKIDNVLFVEMLIQ
jgi:flagellar protein FliL